MLKNNYLVVVVASCIFIVLGITNIKTSNSVAAVYGLILMYLGTRLEYTNDVYTATRIIIVTFGLLVFFFSPIVLYVSLFLVLQFAGFMGPILVWVSLWVLFIVAKILKDYVASK